MQRNHSGKSFMSPALDQLKFSINKENTWVWGWYSGHNPSMAKASTDNMCVNECWYILIKPYLQNKLYGWSSGSQGGILVGPLDFESNLVPLSSSDSPLFRKTKASQGH